MKKILVTLLFIALIAVPSMSNTVETSQYTWQDTARATFLFVAGAWLAHRQLPRLVGQEIYYNAPAFTKALASLFFTIGITGSITGAYQLTMQLYKGLNKDSH